MSVRKAADADYWNCFVGWFHEFCLYDRERGQAAVVCWYVEVEVAVLATFEMWFR